MKQNPQTSKIILVDRWEMDAGDRGTFLKVYALGGETYRIPEKRAKLWEVFKSARHAEPILTIFETYLKNEYIVDARPITDEILKRAVTHLGEKIADAQTEEKNRSTALSYSKDLVIGKAIDLAELYTYAEKNYKFIKGQKVE